MLAVSKKVMPASSAACTTAAVAGSSIRRPKLLQPSPTTETRREPIMRVCMAPPPSSSRLPEPLETIRHLRPAIAFVGELGHQECERLQVAGDPKRAGVERIEAHVADQSHGDFLRAPIVATVQQRGADLASARVEHVEEHLAGDGAEGGDEGARAQPLREDFRTRRGVGYDQTAPVFA